jgi:ethanolamine utilization protein EutN
MILCRVVGNAVATVKHPVYEGHTVLVVQPVEPDGTTARDRAFLAVDSVQAGVGDLVLCAREGNTARQILGGDDDPFHSVVTAVVDEIQHPGGLTLGPGPAGER